MEKISLYIPCLGCPSGGITTGRRIYDHKKNKYKSEEIPTEVDSEADNPQTNE